jgi:hypothetical protein
MTRAGIIQQTPLFWQSDMQKLVTSYYLFFLERLLL